MVKKWGVGFDFYKEVLKALTLWVQFHHLPLALWSEDVLSRIANVIGIPKVADDCTSRQKRLQYARVHVEVDIKVPRIDNIEIDMGQPKSLL